MKTSHRFIAAALALALAAAGSAVPAQQAPGKTAPDNTIVTANLVSVRQQVTVTFHTK